jgi:MFS family permease
MSLAENPGAQPPKTTPSRYEQLVDALRFPDIRTLWVSTVSNQLGQGMQQVVLGWLVLEMTGSGGMVGAIFAARSAPNLIVGLAAGSIADRLDRRILMQLSVWGMMLAALAVVFLLFTNQLTVWQLMLITFLLGTLQAFCMTARQVYVYDVVGASGAVNGIALISLAQRVGQVLGALLAGALIQWQGSGVCFLAMGLSYAFGALALYALRHAGESAPLRREPMLENILNYFRALRSNRVMLSLMISTAAAETLGFSHQVIIPILAIEVLHVGAVGLSVLTAFRFVGGALGVVTLAVMGQVRRRGILLLAALVLFGVGQVWLGQSINFLMALVLVTLVNAMAAITDVLHQSLIQLSVSNEQRGRAMGSWIVGIGTAPVGQLQIGYLSELTNARIALLVNGVSLAVLALVMGVVMPRLRRL